MCLTNMALEIRFPANAEIWLVGLSTLMMGLGTIFWNPVSMKYGKRPGMVAAMTVFMAGTIWALYARTFHSMLASRGLQGFGASAAFGLGPNCISDISFLHERGTKLGFYE